MEIFHVLVDTDSTSFKFIFISDPNSETLENKYRDIVFDVIIASEIYKKFDCSHIFWDTFWARKEQKRKKLRYYNIEHINNHCILTLAVNPKEYSELFKDKNLNKKHKSIKKGSSGLVFKNVSQRIKSLVNFDTFEKPPHDTKQLSRLTVVAGEMVKTTVTKSKFSQLNDKRFYFPHRVVYLPFQHPVLAEIDEFKQKKAKELKNIFGKRKNISSI